jgi:hypothetical protein
MRALAKTSATEPADPVCDLLRELVAEVRGLRGDLAQQAKRGTFMESRFDAAHLLATIAASVQGRLFTAAELLQHTVVDADLAAALRGIRAPKVPSSEKVVGATQTGTPTAYWVGENAPKPLTSLAFAALSLPPRKVAADVPLTDELIKVASIDILNLIERQNVSAVATAMDTALLDPANAGIVDVKPASLTNGLTGITPAGDFQNNIGQVLAAISGGAPTRPVIVVSLQTALRLRALQDLAAIGVNIVVSPAAANRVIGIDADAIVTMDDGGDMRIGQGRGR